MGINRQQVIGHVLLINLTSEPLPDGHLHLDQATATLPDFDAESSCIVLQGKYIQLSMLHPAVLSAVPSIGFGVRDLEMSILKMQSLFGCIVIFCSPGQINRAVSALVVAASGLRKPVIFVSNEAGLAMVNLSLALRVAASLILEGVVVAEISIVARGERSRVI